METASWHNTRGLYRLNPLNRDIPTYSITHEATHSRLQLLIVTFCSSIYLIVATMRKRNKRPLNNFRKKCKTTKMCLSITIDFCKNHANVIETDVFKSSYFYFRECFLLYLVYWEVFLIRKLIIIKVNVAQFFQVTEFERSSAIAQNCHLQICPLFPARNVAFILVYSILTKMYLFRNLVN